MTGIWASPHEDFGGPGHGNGGRAGAAGENGQALGNLLIVSEDGDSDDPDYNASGGTIIFTFENPTDIDSVELLDIDDNSERGTVKAFDGNGALIAEATMAALGNSKLPGAAPGRHRGRAARDAFPEEWIGRRNRLLPLRPPDPQLGDRSPGGRKAAGGFLLEAFAQ